MGARGKGARQAALGRASHRSLRDPLLPSDSVGFSEDESYEEIQKDKVDEKGQITRDWWKKRIRARSWNKMKRRSLILRIAAVRGK